MLVTTTCPGGMTTRVRRLAALGLALATPLTTPAEAQVGPRDPARRLDPPEVMAGIFDHGANFHPLGERLIFPRAPAGLIYEGQEEDDTADIQLGYRFAPVRFLLKPRVVAKVQISTAGRTSFASLGAEYRQYVLRGRVYGQIGVGVTVHDGYRFTPDPFAPGIANDEALRRYRIYMTRTGYGSRVLFNPNASIGVRIGGRWAAELAWEHYSHRQIFSDQNPGLDSLGLRLIRRLGR